MRTPCDTYPPGRRFLLHLDYDDYDDDDWYYRLGMVYLNKVNSKFHLIRSYCEIFFYHFPNIPCLKCTVNSNFHLIRSKTLLTNVFELTVPHLYEDDEDPENDKYDTDYDNDYYGYGRNWQEVDGQCDDVNGGWPPRFTSTPKDAGKNPKTWTLCLLRTVLSDQNLM